jgi:hypothetical protein
MLMQKGQRTERDVLEENKIINIAFYLLAPGWLCQKLLMALEQPVIRRLPNSLCPSGKNPL